MDIRELQDFFDQSQDVMAIVSRDLRYEAVNLEYCRYWDVFRDQILGAEVVSVVGPEAFNGYINEYLLRCLTGEDVVYERWLDFPGTGRRHMHVRYSPRRDESGEVTGVFLISRDTTERMNLQSDISSERDKFSQILSALHVGLVVYNRDMTIEWHNEQLLRMFPDFDLSGSPNSLFVGDPEEPGETCPAHITMSTGEECSIEKCITATGRTIVETTVPIRDADGRVSHVLGHIVDVTEARKSIEDLKDRQARLDSVFRATRAGIGVVKDRKFTQVNDHLCDLLGYSREELVGQSVRKVYVSQEAYVRAGREIYGSMEGDCTVSIESQVKRSDGMILDALITVTFMDPDDPDVGATFVAMDISDMKRAEKAVLESEVRFRNVFENVDMIAVQGYDRDRRVVYWNPASVRLYGYTREEAMGQLLEDLIIPDPMRDTVIDLHEAWVNGGQPIPAGELELAHKTGRPVPVYSCHVMQETPLGDKYMYCLDVDLTEMKRIHTSLVKAKEEAEAANKAKSEFLANMSHEIRTPLNGIKGMLSLLQMSDLDDSQMEYAQAGIDSATRLNYLLSDILDLSRAEAGMMTIDKEMFNLQYLIGQLEGLFQFSFQEKGMKLECHVDEDIPAHVVGDSARLQQILTNLVGNGLKYADSGTVRLDVSLLPPVNAREYRVLFSVSDTGIGISDEVLKTLFEPFTQGSQGYTRQYQGAGLGLSICKRLVSLMGGNMSVETTLGEGSVFHVTIPFDRDMVFSEPALVDGRCHIGTAAPINVLLAEDDRLSTIVGMRMLEKAGCYVTTVSDGIQAIEELRKEEYSAVFMDIQMPGMDGVTATRNIRNGLAGVDNSDIPIFALTAFTMVGDREKFLDAGMDGYIPKPVEMDDIIGALRYALEKQFDAAI